MTDHLHRLRSTTHLFKQASSSFFSNFFTFLLLSLLLLSFRLLVENGTHRVTSFIDHDPSLNALLSRLDPPPNQSHRVGSPDSDRRFRRRHPFLHFKRVGTLDDDLFSGDGDDDRRLFGAGNGFSPNRSFVMFTHFDSMVGFSDSVVDNGISVSEVVRSGVAFRARITSLDVNEDGAENQDEGNGDLERENVNGQQDMNRVVNLQFVKGLELDNLETAALFFMVSFLSAVYGWVILSFTLTYSLVLGMVFISVVNDLTGRFSSLVGIICDGTMLGLKRLSGFIIMKWAVRDALTQLLGLWYFGEIENKYSFFKLFVRLKLMPFSIMSPWVKGFEKEISGFISTWFLMDSLLAFLFAVDAWAVLADSRRSGREIVKEGCYLLSIMLNQAVQINCLEAIFCGPLVRAVIGRTLGKYVAMAFQSVVEVYFMVTWLVFYLSARCRDAHEQGRRFGQRELEGLTDGLR
ncbi:uncharacterized protein E6C27_scaffold908G00350 [Cucumis melo var. makuwa]|uniref:Transmembrane protein n=2 Tax=Cucumis melo TaxID=3656 RepID=A0A5A7TUW1_CUCMM|nr:uncharacterized protein E6C27_scaffold908G00350 [Cucumis melo var. makuwa]